MELQSNVRSIACLRGIMPEPIKVRPRVEEGEELRFSPVRQVIH